MSTSTERLAFLKRLDESSRVEVTEWEARFIASNLNNATMSQRQIEAVERMMEKYEHRL